MPSVVVRAAVVMAGGLVALACSSAERSIAVHLETAGAEPPWVRVSGLTDLELERLRTAVWREEGWQALLQVTTPGGNGAPLAGRYIASREGLEFHPRAPLRQGQSYQARFDPGRLPVPRASPVVEATLAVPSRPESPRALVTAVSPSSEVWPANVLRFYVHFSASMSRTEGQQLVQLLDDRGQVIPGAIVATAIDFWNAERTRYTGFLSSGAALPGASAPVLRPVLEPGREYTLAVDEAWRDAAGRSLEQEYRQTFRAGPPVREPLRLSDWRVSPPSAGSAGPVVVAFPRALDVGLLDRSVAVAPAGEAPLVGTVTLSPGGAGWQFVPASAWRRGPHELLVLSTLEDPAGNRVGSAGPAAREAADGEPPPPKQFRIPFSVK